MQTINDLCVSNVMAKQLKELGFDEPCIAIFKGDNEFPTAVDQLWGMGVSGICSRSGYKIYEDECLAPMFEQVRDWLREEHNIHIAITSSADLIDEDPVHFIPNGKYEGTLDDVLKKDMYFSDTLQLTPTSDTHKEALIKAIEESIKLIKNRK